MKVEEIWKGTENPRYEVSSEGRVRRINTLNSRRQVIVDHPTIIKPSISNAGYQVVTMESKVRSVHRLVAKAFIPNPNGLSDVDHLDGNKMNNRVSNLRWVTHQDNCKSFKKMRGIIGYGEFILEETGEYLGSYKEASEKLNISIYRMYQIVRLHAKISKGEYKGFHVTREYKNSENEIYRKKIEKKIDRWVEIDETGERIGTCKEASEKLGLSRARISQLCKEYTPIRKGKYKGLHLTFHKERKISTKYINILD